MSSKFIQQAKRHAAQTRPRLKKKAKATARKRPSSEELKESHVKDSRGLNTRQKLFIEYASSGKPGDAAIAAGYSAKTAASMASTLLKKPNVKAAVEKAQAKRLQRLSISGDAILAEIAKVGFAEVELKDIKVSDKVASLTLLARHAGLLVEKHEVDTRQSILNLNVTAQDLADAQRLAIEHGFGRSPPLAIESAKVEGEDEGENR